MNVISIKKIVSGGFVAFGLTLSGCLTDDEGGANVTLTAQSVVMGAQANSAYGSFINLDNYTVLTQAQANANSGSVDLIFAYSGSAQSTAVYSPDSAKVGINGGPGLTIAQGMATTNHSDIRTISTAGFDLVNTKAGMDSLYNAGVATANGRLLVSLNSTFAAKTNLGQVVGVKITSITVADSLSIATLSGLAKW